MTTDTTGCSPSRTRVAAQAHACLGQMGPAVLASQAPVQVEVSIQGQFCFVLPGPFTKLSGLRDIIIGARATNSRAPIFRWDTTEATGAFASAAYGAFMVHAAFSSDSLALGISRTEAQGLEPIVALVLEASYGVLWEPTPSSRCRSSLRNSLVGFFLGAGGSFSSKGEASSASVASAP